MFEVGDRILYPMHGAGVIEKIEEQKVLGQKQAYYIMNMQPEGMKVMIPVATCEEIGVRFIISKDEGQKVLEQFVKEPVVSDDNWNRRHRENMAKIKSGDIFKVLEVVKNLMFRDRAKGLSTSERKMLAVSRKILVSELVLSGVADRSDIESIMVDTIEGLI